MWAWLMVGLLGLAWIIPAEAATVHVKLAWTDASGNETGFKVQRQESSGAFVDLSRVGANVTTYTDQTLKIGVSYCYRVLATNAYGDSDPSNTVCLGTIAPVAPRGLTITTTVVP